MPEYLSPGVYVEEIASAVQAIAGVSTSTAAFIGILPDAVDIPEPNPTYDPTRKVPAVPAPGLIAAPSADTSSASRKPNKSTPASGDGGESAPDATVVGSAALAAAPASDPALSPYITKQFAIQVASGDPQLVTNFGEFRRLFGGFSTNSQHNILVQAAFGFFNNGGSRLYVIRLKGSAELNDALARLEAVDEVAIVAAPGLTDPAILAGIVSHCEKTQNRFAIFDTPEIVAPIDSSMLPADSKNAALYFPWIQVFDPGLKIREPEGKGLIFVPPSGHMAGIYARVDINRGVFKAPANEVVLGAVGLRYPLSKSQQDGLNPTGVNCIRNLNGNIRVWGARTIGGARNHEFTYVNVRRTLLYLRTSIDLGTQWVVFEPNDLSLWAKITRNVTAFLTNVWHDGALFGATAAEAFYVKCDRETNPPETRELGQVITEIGVAIVRPAEFVIFRISQWTAPQA
ncbi:MAG TPA: phage tail sheath subtilisin-like domain-containing protein [Bryocella sp.]|nr:phage tail sheath subtilisin-like domain-containing protein [Bryocella sp.]